MEDKIKLIIDTDLGADCDDVGALLVAFELQNEGECDLLAIGHCCLQREGYLNIDILRNYYHVNVPIGVYNGKPFTNNNDFHLYDKKINKKYKEYLSNCPEIDSYKLYRKVLSEQPDHSVTFVTIGELSNISLLINSGPDEFSSLSGKELINKKVKAFYTMGGRFYDNSNLAKTYGDMSEGEYNLLCDIESADNYLKNVTRPIYFVDFYAGADVVSPTFNKEWKVSPLTDSYKWHDSKNGRMSWDLITVYCSIFNDLYENIGPGIVDFDTKTAITKFKLDQKGNMYYLRPKVDKSIIVERLTNIVKKMEDRNNG